MENVSPTIKEDNVNQELIYWSPLQSYNQGGCRKSRTDLLESSTAPRKLRVGLTQTRSLERKKT